MSSLLKRWTSSTNVAAPQPSAPPLADIPSPSSFVEFSDSLSLPPLSPVLRRGVVSVEEYASLHALSSRLSSRLAERDRALQLAVGLLAVAVFLPGLLSLLVTVCLTALFAAYYYNVQPYRARIDGVFRELSRLFGTMRHSAGSARIDRIDRIADTVVAVKRAVEARK